VIFPGMGRLLDGRTLTGVLISAAWSGAILALLMRPRLLQFSGVGGTRPLILVTILLTLLASAAWVLGNLRPARHADAPAGGWQWR